MATTTVHTQRCTLRPHRIEDFERYYAFWRDEANDVPGGPPEDAGAAWSRLLFFIGHWSQFKFGMFLVLDPATDAIVGEVGYRFIPREFGQSFDNHPEAGWTLGKTNRGQGIASEAMLASTDWMDANFPGRTVCFVHPNNEVSLRVANRIGFEAFAEAHFKSDPVILLERNHQPEGARG